MCRFLYLTKMLLFSSSNCFKILKLQSVETQFNSVEDFLFHLHFFREYTCSRSQLKQECLEVRSFQFIIVICLQMWGTQPPLHLAFKWLNQCSRSWRIVKSIRCVYHLVLCESSTCKSNVIRKMTIFQSSRSIYLFAATLSKYLQIEQSGL